MKKAASIINSPKRRNQIPLIALCSFAFMSSAFGQVIATCSNPEGYANYHHKGLIPKKDSGFQKDKITGGLTTIQRLNDGQYDVLIVDSRKQVISFGNDGGKILLLRQGKNDASFLVMFPHSAIEIYTIYIDNDGIKRFDILQSKGGDQMPIHKSALLSGLCSEINLQYLKK